MGCCECCSASLTRSLGLKQRDINCGRTARKKNNNNNNNTFRIFLTMKRSLRDDGGSEEGKGKGRERGGGGGGGGAGRAERAMTRVLNRYESVCVFVCVCARVCAYVYVCVHASR